MQSIFASDYSNLELIVLENTPSGVTRQLLAERFAHDSRLRYVEERCRGLSDARNAGLALAACELVAFTADDDVIVDRWWLRRAAEAFEQRDDVACVTGLILPLELETEASCCWSSS